MSFKIHGSSRWSKSKDSLARDDRYKALPRDLREKTFRDFVADQRVRQLNTPDRGLNLGRDKIIFLLCLTGAM